VRFHVEAQEKVGNERLLVQGEEDTYIDVGQKPALLFGLFFIGRRRPRAVERAFYSTLSIFDLAVDFIGFGRPAAGRPNPMKSTAKSKMDKVE